MQFDLLRYPSGCGINLIFYRVGPICLPSTTTDVDTQWGYSAVERQIHVNTFDDLALVRFIPFLTQTSW